jgi:hypothetical protein
MTWRERTAQLEEENHERVGKHLVWTLNTPILCQLCVCVCVLYIYT